MTTNLNETFAAVQVASRELALLNDNVINQKHLSFFQRTKKTSHGWTKMIRSTIG